MMKYDPRYGAGWLPYVNLEGQWPTYSVRLSQVALVAGAFLTLAASTNDQLVKLTRVEIGPSVATAAGVQVIQAQLLKAAPTGGTAGAVPTVYQYDSADNASTVVPAFYTAAPVVAGAALQAVVRDGTMNSAAVASAIGGNALAWRWGDGTSKCPRLRPAVGNFIALTANAALAGQLVDVFVEWTEQGNE